MPVLVVPGAVDEDSAEARPGDGVDPADGREGEAVGGKAAAEDIELDIEEVRVGAAVRRIGHEVCGRQQGDFSHVARASRGLTCVRLPHSL